MKKKNHRKIKKIISEEDNIKNEFQNSFHFGTFNGEKVSFPLLIIFSKVLDVKNI